ncbi:hypothetical protein SLS60_002956 [Paraconiothyrium brasiliense]|uniref:Uncharacterized protein n=1 Tax=Paraconiothyrium brasiliense TaxID=300254 RepID=A0ABR3RUJ8_9PLEO
MDLLGEEMIPIDPETDHLIKPKPDDDCFDYSPHCQLQNPWIVAGYVFGAISLLTFVLVAIWVLRDLHKRQVARRRSSQILPRYLNTGQDGAARSGDGGEEIQLRRLSRRASVPRPLNVERQRSDTTNSALDGGDAVDTGGSPHSVASDDTVIRYHMPRAGLPRAPVRTHSVDRLPQYEEVEREGGWMKAQLEGGIGRAM